jgi:hypothetical protein
MADTRILKSKVEDYVREWLKQKFGQPFQAKLLVLSGVQGTPKTHEFDAVSQDGKIICSIKTASWKTSGGNRGSGKIQGAYTELYFLNLVQAREKYLVLSDPEFFRCFTQDCTGRLALGTALLHCSLSAALCAEVDAIRKVSRSELGFQESSETVSQQEELDISVDSTDRYENEHRPEFL